MILTTYAVRILKKMMKLFLSGQKKTALFWGKIDSSNVSEYWWNFETIRGFIQEKITGDPSRSWHTKMILKKQTPFGRVLTFGDGYGMAVEGFQRGKDTTEIVYLNLSKGEGIRFKKKMEEWNLGIPYSFIQADANTFDFYSLGYFDTIIDVGLFHHVENFESLFPQLNRILREDGIMYVDEYVGPSKFGFTGGVIDIINNWLISLPEELVACSKKVTREDFIKLWIRSDEPSEGIRSGELDGMLRRHFDLVETVPFGGTVLQPFFLTCRFKPGRLNIHNWHNTETGRKEIARLVQIEHDLVKSGAIEKDYIYYMFKKKMNEIY